MANMNGKLIDDGIIDEYTVVGFWFETMQRWADVFQADTPLDAEEQAQRFAREVKFMHLGVVAVFEGRQIPQDGYAEFVDPVAKSQDDMNMVMEELGLWRVGENHLSLNRKDNNGTKKWWQ